MQTMVPDLTRLLTEFQEALRSTDLATREFALANLLPALILKDAAAVARVAETIHDPELREEVLHWVAQFWAAQDPSGALAWTARLAEGAERDAARADIYLKVAEVDPAEAIQMHEQFGTDSIGNQILENLGQQWAEKDFPAALEWVLTRPPGEQRDDLVGRLAFVQSQTLPVEAARLVLKQIPPGGAQEEAVISVLHQLALRDFVAAASWVEQFPQSWLRQRAQLELSGIATYHQQAKTP